MPPSETVLPEFILTFFGPMQVLVQGQPLPHLRSRKALWLLALLTLHQNRPVQREWLAEILWPDVDRPQSLRSLRVILSELKRALGSQGERLQSPTRSLLSLDLTGATVDVLTFDTAVTRNIPSALEQAVSLYRGPLLEGCTEEWVFAERELRERKCLEALQNLAEAALSTGENDAAAAYYRQAIGIAPLWDAVRRGWMEALARSGDMNAALRVYREFVELLRSDSHATPDAETTALYTRLRTEARKKPSTQSDDPMEKMTTPTVTGSLPHPQTALVGREDERLEVTALLRHSRSVTLVGMGGIGKTRLASEVAAQVAREYPDGVGMVALESLSEGSQIARQTASVLGLREAPGQTPLQCVTAYLQQKRLLLVLDNCEHLIEASAHFVEHLLRDCAGIRVLATSREALGILGETIWAVPALAVPDSLRLSHESDIRLSTLADYEGVQLFLQRAQAAQKDFTLTERNGRDVAQICTKLEGIPLALELAASQVRRRPVEEIYSHLDDYLGIQSAGNAISLSRQQTLRATMDWSIDLLSEAERTLLRRLSVFVGGWTLEAAEYVGGQGSGVGEVVGYGVRGTGERNPNMTTPSPAPTSLSPNPGPPVPAPRSLTPDPDVLDLLISLVDKSLVLFEEGESGGRYRLLEIVRQYTAEHLRDSGEMERIQVRHAQYYAAFAEEADQQLYSAAQAQWLNRLETEHDNLRAALYAGLRATDDAETALRLTGALWRFWDIHSHFSEGRQFLRLALEQEGAQAVIGYRAKAFTGAGAMALREGDFTEARAFHQQSLNILRQIGDKRRIAASLANQGTVAQAQGDYASARTLLEESLSLHRALENKIGICNTLRPLANLAQRQSEFLSALRYIEEGLSLCRELEDQHGISYFLEDFGSLHFIQGQYVTAQASYEESLSLRRQLGDKLGIAFSLGNLGLLAREHEDYTVAQIRFEECTTLFKELGNHWNIAWTMSHQGILAKELGDHSLAQTLLAESLAILRQAGDQYGISIALSNLGDLMRLRGDYVSAHSLLQESLTIRYEMSNPLGVADSLVGMAALCLAQSEPEKAVRLWGFAHALLEKISAAITPRVRKHYESFLAQAHSILDETVFQAAWDSGCAIPWERICDEGSGVRG